MKRFFQWLFRWQVFGNVAVGFAVLITLLLVAFTIEGVRGRRAWDHFQTEWESRGESFDLYRMIPPPVPDDENMAMAPFFAPLAEQKWNPDSQTLSYNTNALTRITSRFPHWNPTNSGVWRLAMPTDLDALAHAATGPATNNDTAARRILDALGPYSSLMLEVTEATRRPKARFNNQYGAGIRMLILHPVVNKVAAIIFKHRASAQLAQSRPDLAWEDLQIQFRLADSIKSEPVLISHLVRIAILEMALQIIWEGLSANIWTEPQWEAISRELAQLRFGEDYQLCIRGEAVMISETFFDEAIRGRINSLREVLGSDDTLLRFMPNGWLYQNKTALAKLHFEIALPVFETATGRFRPDRAANLQSQLDSMQRSPYNIYSFEFFPALAKASIRFAVAQNGADMARTAIAIERHRMKFGMLPRSLSDLVAAKFMDKVPADIIDGRPMRYSIISPTEYRLYSVGWNESDELGIVTGYGIKKAFPRYEEGDWVWFSRRAAPE